MNKTGGIWMGGGGKKETALKYCPYYEDFKVTVI